MVKHSSDGKAKRDKREATAKAQEAPAASTNGNHAGRKSSSVHLDRALGKKSPEASVKFLRDAANVIEREAGIRVDAPASTSEPAKGVSKDDAKRHATVEKVIAAHAEASGKPATHFSRARTLARKGDVDGLRTYLRDKLTSGTSIRGKLTADLIKALSS